MKKIISFFAYIIALACFFIILNLFLNYNKIAVAFSKLPFMKINPVYSGGDIKYIIKKEDYKINIHEPVYPSLIKKAKNGFIQLDYEGNLSDIIIDSIDFDNDKTIDFILQSDNDILTLDKINNQITDVIMNLNTSKGKLIRVGIVRE